MEGGGVQKEKLSEETELEWHCYNNSCPIIIVIHNYNHMRAAPCRGYLETPYDLPAVDLLPLHLPFPLPLSAFPLYPAQDMGINWN